MVLIMIILYAYSDKFSLPDLRSLSDEKRLREYMRCGREPSRLLSYPLIKLALKHYGIDYDKQTKYKNEYGYEYISSQICYSLSHSDKLCVAMASRGRCGIDCQKTVRREVLPTARRFFTENETEHIMRSEDGLYEFYKIWTRKESYMKLIGRGFGTSPRSFDTTDGSVGYTTLKLGEYVLSYCTDEKTDADTVPIECTLKSFK